MTPEIKQLNKQVRHLEYYAMMIGMLIKNGQWFQHKEAFSGVEYFSSEGKLVWEQKMMKE